MPNMEKISVYPKTKWHTLPDGQTVQKLLQKQGYIHNCNYFRKQITIIPLAPS